MNENEQLQKEELSLMGLVKILLSKIKILILVLLCGCVVGGALGFAKSHDIYYWGTRMEFYANPERPKTDEDTELGGGSTYGSYGAYSINVLDNIVWLLNSERFKELLILNGDVLPKKGVWVNPENEAEVALDLDAKIYAAQLKLDATESKQDAYQDAVSEKKQATAAYTEAQNELNEIWGEYYKTGIVKNPVFNESEYKTNLLEKYNDLKAAYEKVQTAANAELLAKNVVKSTKDEYNDAKKISDEATEVALNAWRKTKRYRKLITLYLDSVEFSYARQDELITNSVNLASSFIFVEISVFGKDSEEIAEDLLTRIQSVVPKYVCEVLPIPDGYASTSCVQITTITDIGLMNEGYVLKESVKFALLFAAAAFVIACVVVILIDRSDRRVRDYDQLARQLNIPLLGVIPSIDDQSIDTQNNAEKQSMEA